MFDPRDTRRNLNAWQEDRAAAKDRVRTAEASYTAARRAYDRYTPGAAGQRAAAAKLDGAADVLASAEEALAQVDTYEAWYNR